jgi:glycosyltransferase involved in cell wall biosynthesis
MKIAYLIEGMFNSGGMERVLSVIANKLSNKLQITIITAFQDGRSFFFPINNEISIYDLGISRTKQKQLSNRNILKKEYKKRLEQFLQKEKFDIVVSMGGIDQFFLYKIKDGSKKLIWHHFSFDFYKTTYYSSNPINKIKAFIKTSRRIFFSKKYDSIIVISKSDEKKWKRFSSKVIQIYNPITITGSRQSILNENKVISVGRLDYQKGLDFLISAWSLVAEKHKDWQLDIYGEGELRDSLQEQIDKLHLTRCISLCGRVDDIAEEYTQHSIYVMSSRTESFGLVLLEAASCGLPLVSFNCPSGPSEIIEDGKNGFLINKVGDVQQLANKINLLIENSELRSNMGKNAKKNVQLFSIQNISDKWIDLFHNI